MSRETVPDDWSHDVEAAFAEFRGCRQHGQINASYRVETGTPLRFAIAMQTCWKYGGPATPRTQVNVRNVTWNCIR